jgi:hypothetical protein
MMNGWCGAAEATRRVDDSTGGNSDVARVPDRLRDRCGGCGRDLDGAVHQFHGPSGSHVVCRGCALTYRPLLRRSSAIALLVGSVLVAINQGDLLLAWRGEPALLWKVPLTYLVPFVVATWGGLLNSRAR